MSDNNKSTTEYIRSDVVKALITGIVEGVDIPSVLKKSIVDAYMKEITEAAKDMGAIAYLQDQKCPKCGAGIFIHTKECPYCGADLKGDAE